ncbi:aspartyl/asparaginyl beta-hydroxylase domain-containing protein [Solitalea canadensis]|uniref:Aspartyl/Asparaginyl beta-hydroxylase n=1 Tax=Solitalea canadensis (strain ATCC 29591 / DSM 3403 / JCM 21819 / LMG 8368 / NBRC 15130 / NCIMB 12057 / USAM 9D) TaxID=929556 RepID=H8KRR7_SOLCM|nr:aspartyl/asparaginyl beta-hydroxylase domain-containing protein [Solitalea canadensis]AFD07705.1 Aspartyl/Asparaginyl beta-hydroxylase [Solitalea canadensis DSM 3403]
MNDFFRLPFFFDEDKLVKDLEKCLSLNWTDHFNQRDYNGDWKSISLRSISGNITDANAHPGAEYKDTALLQQCSYFAEVIESINCEKEAIRLLSLTPGSIIKTHVDQELGYSDGYFRLHIPIQTNPDVDFIVNSNDLRMKPGECWYANFSLPHSVANRGTINRIHLVIDCKRNNWSDEVFAESGYCFDLEKQMQSKKQDPETMAKMITELERMDTDTARQLIDQLRSSAV